MNVSFKKTYRGYGNLLNCLKNIVIGSDDYFSTLYELQKVRDEIKVLKSN